jgi:hypothetical protein
LFVLFLVVLVCFVDREQAIKKKRRREGKQNIENNGEIR